MIDAVKERVREMPDRAGAGAGGCYHCGTPCGQGGLQRGGRGFCCLGCLTVFEMLAANGLTDYYRIGGAAGTRVEGGVAPERYDCLDVTEVRERLLDYDDGRRARVTFRLPAIHCVACVWLIENLYRLHGGVGGVQVNLSRGEASIVFDPGKIRLSELAGLLARLGYPPELSLGDAEGRAGVSVARVGRLPLQIGVAGFAFGNIMLMSFPSYLGMSGEDWASFRTLFGGLSVLLAVPVLVFSASDFWRSAWFSVRQRRLTLDVPIAAGLAALFAQSAWDIWTGAGEGYLDSMAGLVFFLLIGRWFQRVTFDRLVFDRDYRSFFPLSVRRRLPGGGEESVPVSRVRAGDRLWIRHGEMVPADGLVRSGCARLDYAFVTGESESVEVGLGERVYAGGRQAGGGIEVELTKAVSQSYLATLWDQPVFRKEREGRIVPLLDRFSPWSTACVLAIAVIAWGGWLTVDVGQASRVFAAVLIVACPCALALAAPVTLGMAQRVLARSGVFVRNGMVIESLAVVDTVIFDKTGTLTVGGTGSSAWDGGELTEEERGCLAGLFEQSGHPYARRIRDGMEMGGGCGPGVSEFVERAGRGLSAVVEGRRCVVGSRRWLEGNGINCGRAVADGLWAGGVVHVGMDGVYRGRFRLRPELRKGMGGAVSRLGREHRCILLSGDTEADAARFREWFLEEGGLQFRKDPMDKLAFVKREQERGARVWMVGDGLNDAGALKQADVGTSVMGAGGAFTPSSDMIIEGDSVARLDRVRAYASAVVRVIRLNLVLSSVYNAVGLGFAVAGWLSPAFCAVLMPLSSATVVLVAVGLARWEGVRCGLVGESVRPGSSRMGWVGTSVIETGGTR